MMAVESVTRLVLMAFLTATAAGCATSTMKSTPFYGGSPRVYTGRVEDRVNLWPFAYYREPSLSVLWPVFSQTDDHLAVRPFYSQYRQGGKDSAYDEFNFLWPLCQFDTRHDSHRIFPVFWGSDHFHVFPFVWNSGDTHCLFPLVWWREGEYFNVFPLYWNTKSTLAVLPLFITGGGGTYVFPSFFRNENLTAFFPFYWRDTSGGELTEWFGPLGYHRGKENSNWFLPFYYRDRDDFVSLPWISYAKDGATGWAIPPLLSWMKRSERGDAKLRFLLGLGGVNTRTNGEIDCSWAFPLFYCDDRGFVSLPFAHLKNDATFVTPFVGVTHREHEKGAWLWPLGGWTNDDRMEAAEAQMNADRLDSKIGVEKREVVLSKDRTHSWHEVTGGIDAHDSSWLLSGLSTGDRTISWSADDEAVTAMDESAFGNLFAYRRESCRLVKFDAKTREKLSEEEDVESGVFCNFLWHSKHEAVKGGRHYDMMSLLWRFWHYENLNGDVSVDSFPFFTYDSKTDGYSKTSLMWRLFRNEYDPKTKRRSVDFLFIPVWR